MTEIQDLEGYIILEGRTHGSYEYPDLNIAIHRLGTSPEVEQAARSLSLVVQNTAQEQFDNTPYIGNINWQKALKLNLALGGRTLNPRQGIDLLLDLQNGIDGRKIIYYGNGKPIAPAVLRNIYNEIVEVRNPWRGEWLDADFKVINGVIHINYDHQLQNGILVPQRKEPLEQYLDARGVNVSLKEFNRQGLATKRNDKGEIHYWKPLPDNNSVAWFVADSDGAGLDCGRFPSIRGSSLGVRRAATREKISEELQKSNLESLCTNLQNPKAGQEKKPEESDFSAIYNETLISLRNLEDKVRGSKKAYAQQEKELSEMRKEYESKKKENSERLAGVTLTLDTSSQKNIKRLLIADILLQAYNSSFFDGLFYNISSVVNEVINKF